MTRSCMANRPRTFNKGMFRRSGYAANGSVSLLCNTEVTVSGYRTDFSFTRIEAANDREDARQ